MIADQMKALAVEYAKSNPFGVDTVEVGCFIEWVYKKEGRPVEHLSVMTEMDETSR